MPPRQRAHYDSLSCSPRQTPPSPTQTPLSKNARAVPILAAIDMIAAHRDECSPSWSRIIRTARARTSGENLLLVCFVMAPPSQELEPPLNPGRFMKTRYTVALSMLAGITLGATAIQGLHAQMAAKKAYTVSELETIDAAANAAFVPLVQAAQKAAGARNLNTGGGKVVGLEGTPPKRVAITEWDSLEKAEA